jgi:hypothetical protein
LVFWGFIGPLCRTGEAAFLLQKKICEKRLLKVLLIAETGLSLSHSFHEIIGNGLAKEPGQT